MADYWVAYRLDAVLEEKLIVGAVKGARYGPYQCRDSNDHKDVLIFFPLVPYRDWVAVEQQFKFEHRRYEKFSVDRYTVLVADRKHGAH